MLGEVKMKSKNDEIFDIEQEQRRLADRLAELRKEPESVKPVVRYYGPLREPASELVLEFYTKEQAEKAKAILEKMEFGDPPAYNTQMEYLNDRNCWEGVGSFNDSPWWIAGWHFGRLRRRA